MSRPNEATRRQQDAARPDASTWLSANAGSGKTRVLTDRVARLLLEDVEPQHILCLTYTKAAASEMQNRLFKRLGAWAMLDNDALRTALAELGLDRQPDDADLRKARTLFARAIETPGGLKIQTIHSFCAALLRRFPLEAEVSPQFTEIEERAAELLRAELVDQMADGPDAPALIALARHYTGEDFLSLTGEIVTTRAPFRDLSRNAALALFDAPPDQSRAAIEAAAFLPTDAALIQAIVPVLNAGSSTDAKAGARLAAVTQLDYAALPILQSVFLTGEKAKAPFSAKIGSFPTKSTRAALADHMAALDDLMHRVEDARRQSIALDAAERTHALHQFARRFQARYAEAKMRRGWLDFEDLITRTRALLNTSAVAAWVLYRLDGGIDHILVDEAQDTSPAQWDVIRKLAEEFASGAGARPDVTRTLFVVGDKKQSIYSFQGADPEAFNRMRDEFDAKLAQSGQDLQKKTLDYSFRSSPAILRLVDTVFDAAAATGFEAQDHIAFHGDLAGRVDLWPLVPKPEQEADRDWFDPVDRRVPATHDRTLAGAIAQQIQQMIADQVALPTAQGARPVRAGDFLILVRRRSTMFSELIRACKALDLPIAGADRLKVGGEVAVRDIAALLSFLATPDDNLSLAAALRSPLFGWTEQDLFTLAHHRQEAQMWRSLRAQAAQYPQTVSVLDDLRNNIDFLRPYDLIERILTRHRGRARLLARLGAEAEDGIDALLQQALAYERTAVPSLTGFLTWMETDDLEIKRQIDSASDQIRVMTVHGAKGLEAPIVILPECSRHTLRVRGNVMDMAGTPVWRMPGGAVPAPMQTALDGLRQTQDAEGLRLLYVALTRAEQWLIVGAAGDLSKAGDTWHQRIEAGLTACDARPLDTPVGPGLRLEHGDWAVRAVAADAGTRPTAPVLPDVFNTAAPPTSPPAKTRSPSDLGGAKALPGEGLPEDVAKSYGTLVHRMLEVAHRLPAADQPLACDRVAAASLLDEALITRARDEVRAVLEDPALQAIFAADALAEVPVTAPLGATRLHGTIDRLIVGPDALHVIDFKTNRTVPDTATDCPEGVLRQLGAYAHALQQIYPDFAINLSILWTSKRLLMPIPHDIVTPALARAQYLDGPATDT